MKKLLLIVLLSGMTGMLYSQNSFKESLKNYDDICYCDVGLKHPKIILDMDNNLEILFGLKNGRTLKELERFGVKYNQSQISLLLASGLIEVKDSVFYATVPILSKDETIVLRTQTKEIAGDIVRSIQKEYELFMQTLKTKGLQKNSYSLFFALVLDRIVWDILEQDGVIKELTITKEKPFWDGLMWMIEPKRKFFCGTNSITSGNVSISENWSENAGVTVTSYKTLRIMLNDYKENGRVTNPVVFKTFEGNELFDKTGNLQIPIIKADSTDVIYSQSMNIASIIVKYLNNNIDYSKLLANYPNLAKGHAITILYHEIMWDILDIMESAGQIKKPVAFGKPDEAKPMDLKDLMFILKN